MEELYAESPYNERKPLLWYSYPHTSTLQTNALTTRSKLTKNTQCATRTELHVLLIAALRVHALWSTMLWGVIWKSTFSWDIWITVEFYSGWNISRSYSVLHSNYKRIMWKIIGYKCSQWRPMNLGKMEMALPYYRIIRFLWDCTRWLKALKMLVSAAK